MSGIAAPDRKHPSSSSRDRNEYNFGQSFVSLVDIPLSTHRPTEACPLYSSLSRLFIYLGAAV